MLGHDLAVTAPNDAVEVLLQGAPKHWLSNACVTQNQVLLLDHSQVQFEKLSASNPETLLLGDDLS